MNKFENIDAFYIESIFKKIPQQGPLEFFVHHNTLHHYEYMNFFEAVKRAAIEYSANAFMSEAFYLYKYKQGLIKDKLLHQEIEEFIDKNKIKLSSDIIWRLLSAKSYKLSKKIKHEIDALQETYYITQPIFYSQIIKDDYGIDIDFHTCSTIYRFMSNYFDFGAASWSLSHREKGMWYHFCELHASHGLLESRYRNALAKLIKQTRSREPIDAIQHVLQLLQIETNAIEGFLFSLCIKHKGWAGFIKSLREHPEYIINNEIIPDLIAFVAIILVCEYAAICAFVKHKIIAPRDKKMPLHNAVFLARYIYKVEKHPELKAQLELALPFLTDFNRQEIFHRAYEKTLYQQFINAYMTNKKYIAPLTRVYQVILCMDDREESLRRYLEIDSDCETLGTAGHFGLNIEYKGYFDKRYRALCPINVKPEFKINEIARKINPFKLRLIQILSDVKWYINKGSKSIIGGYLISILSSIYSIIPFILDVIDPRIILHIKKMTSGYFQTAVITDLDYKMEDGVMQGISQSMRVNFAESLLTTIGLKQYFAPYIFVIGHGSMSLNNPHRAAYDCGACGGGIGAVNARLMAKILNESQIRQELSERNINIPESCKFIGAYHNTCSDEIDFFDLPKDNDLNEIISKIRHAAILEAQERSRRFSNSPLKRKPEYYFKSVQARALDMRQPRAEYGHSTNALFVIGPREYTHNLFLDRRAFLLSYEPQQDKDMTILKKLLTATIPVISGINLEYYFSYIDNEIYGAGTKLPHNVNALIGVINGHLSDLRAGLPWQMVEIHQPVRLFLLVIANLDNIRQLLSQTNTFNQIIQNDWIKFAVHDIKTNTIWIYKNHDFEQASADDCAPDYLPYDMKILSSRHHMEFGHITHGN